MKALKQKWNSRRGASILLALLFLLVCMMAGASIVMAAASNAGKYSSNKTEQQKYLTVSSAMNMLIDELEGVTYAGRYTYKSTPFYEYADEDGNVVDESDAVDADWNLKDGYSRVTHYSHNYIQNTGSLTGSDWLGTVLPLRDDLDYIFARAGDEDEKFEVPENLRTYGDEYPDPEVLARLNSYTPADHYILTFTAPDGYGGLNETVSIKVTLRMDGSILLSTQDDGSTAGFRIMALLRPDGRWPKDVLTLPDEPAEANLVSGSLYQTGEITWTLEYIFKQEA